MNIGAKLVQYSQICVETSYNSRECESHQATYSSATPVTITRHTRSFSVVVPMTLRQCRCRCHTCIRAEPLTRVSHSVLFWRFPQQNCCHMSTCFIAPVRLCLNEATHMRIHQCVCGFSTPKNGETVHRWRCTAATRRSTSMKQTEAVLVSQDIQRRPFFLWGHLSEWFPSAIVLNQFVYNVSLW